MTTTDYTYTTAVGLYLLGQVASSSAVQGGFVQSSTYSYDWYDGAVKTGAMVTGPFDRLRRPASGGDFELQP